MNKACMVLFCAVCCCCVVATGTSLAGVANPALTPVKKVSGLQTTASPNVKPPAGPVELSLAPTLYDGSGAYAQAPAAPVSLALDDGTCDHNFGNFGQFLYLNQFTPGAGEYPFVLNQVQVYFSSGFMNSGTFYESNTNVGDNFMVVIYENTDNFTNPAVGSNLLATFSATVQAIDAWNVYSLSAPVRFYGPGDVLIGVIALDERSSYWPATLDMSIGYMRAWYGYWSSSPPPDPPTLPPDERWTNLNYAGAGLWGSWLIRGYGVTGTCIDVDNDTYGDNCTTGPDCDDNNSAIHPGVAEACNGMDDNCNGQTDEGCSNSTTTTAAVTTTTVAVCIDQDSDGYGVGCALGADCDDTDAFYTDTCQGCKVTIMPKILGRLIGDKEKTRSLLVIGEAGTEFGENPVVKWESDAIDGVITRVFFKRFMFMKATFNGGPLEKQDYRVLVGDCEGKITWSK